MIICNLLWHFATIGENAASSVEATLSRCSTYSAWCLSLAACRKMQGMPLDLFVDGSDEGQGGSQSSPLAPFISKVRALCSAVFVSPN